MTVREFMTVLFVLVWLSGCSDNSGEIVDKSPQSSTPVSEAASSSAPPSHPPIPSGHGMAGASGKATVDGTTVQVGVLAMTVDPAWISEPPKSAMRAAQFHLLPPEGVEGAGELVLFQGIGGSADANIQRWIGQFSQREGEPSVENKTIGGLTVHLLDVSGVYSGAMGMSNESASRSRMLAAVVEGHPTGPWHIKLTGPVETLAYWKIAFLTTIESLKIVS